MTLASNEMKERSPRSAWTNSSVRQLAGKGDPVEAVLNRVRSLILTAIDQGWSGPPFDPLALSTLMGIRLVPRADIRDARTVPQNDTQLCIEYNPTRPRGRLRYSVAHEIGHTLFPDCAERIRNRSSYHDLQEDEWQLEVLCNIAAAEILMPIGTLEPKAADSLSIDRVLEMRQTFDVSTEAVLIRLMHVADVACAAFVASRVDAGPNEGRYQIEYAIPSRKYQQNVPAGTLLPSRSVVEECTAIGFTAKSDEELPALGRRVHLECVGIPPYPGRTYPRVAGFFTSDVETTSESQIHYLKGNALDPRGSGKKLIVHVVNDATPNWGGRGFAVALKNKWPIAQEQFKLWAAADRNNLKVGHVHITGVTDEITVASMVCQKGYGPAAKSRIRYAALSECLAKASALASEIGASVHMPRIGCGEAGGMWFIVEELIESALVSRNIATFVYDLPSRPAVPLARGVQPALFA
jgi:Zn-dependent peptidase ImmA (M78 family)